jgi:hypothetical protein
MKEKITNAGSQQNVEQCRPLHERTGNNIEKHTVYFKDGKLEISHNYEEYGKCHV